METPKTSAQRGFRTFIQAVGASVVGLFAAVWNVPGVPETIVSYAQHNWFPLFLTFATFIGIPAGLIAYFQNKAEGNK